ncbi:MAG: ATP-binding protein [Desulfobacteraceae bacterium]
MHPPQEHLLCAIKALKRQMIVISPSFVILATKDDADGLKDDRTKDGQLCHQALFNRPAPCDACPAKVVRKTGQPALIPDSEGLKEYSADACFYAYPIPYNGETPSGADDAAIGAIAVMGCDVVILKGLDDKLERSHAFLRNLIQSALDGVISADRTGKIIMFNDAAAQITGFSTKEAMAQLHISQLYPEGVAYDVMGRLRSDKYGGKGKLKSFHVDVVTRRGDLIPISLDAAIVYEKGREVASIGIFHDLREELRMKAELEKAQVQLLQAEKMSSLGKLAAGVAHQLNNPIGGITLFASLLLEEYDMEDGAKEDIRRILKEAERCRDTVKELLEFARQTDYFVRPHDINKIIRRTLFLLENQPLFHNIETRDRLADDLPLIYVDAQQMNHLFMNIILNAAQAMQGKGQLFLTSAWVREDDCIRIEIEDTGPGIPDTILPMIFDPFFTTKEEGEGTGLGLSIVYGIVNTHKGNVKAVNRAGQGTAFIIELPLGQRTE